MIEEEYTKSFEVSEMSRSVKGNLRSLAEQIVMQCMKEDASGLETAVSMLISGGVLGMSLAYGKCTGDQEAAEELKKFFLARMEEAVSAYQSKKN